MSCCNLCSFFSHKHTCIYIFMYVYVYMYMYRSLFTNVCVCVCTYYMAIRLGEYFFKLLPKLLFHFMICNSLSLCVCVCAWECMWYPIVQNAHFYLHLHMAHKHFFMLPSLTKKKRKRKCEKRIRNPAQNFKL